MDKLPKGLSQGAPESSSSEEPVQPDHLEPLHPTEMGADGRASASSREPAEAEAGNGKAIPRGTVLDSPSSLEQALQQASAEDAGHLKSKPAKPTERLSRSPSAPFFSRPQSRPAEATVGAIEGEAKVSINFLLFINLRNHSSALVEDIRSTLRDLQGSEQFELEITQVREHPQLAEHFKLVATPSLVKTQPLPTQVLTGSNVTEQLRYWWPRWISEAKLLKPNEELDPLELDLKGLPTEISEYIFGLEDEAFRLRKEKESLQAQLRFRDRIISILAHDLRNPLMGASLAIETLSKGLSQETPPIPEGLELQLVKQAKGQLKVLDNLVADMLQPDWGQERLTIEPQRCDLAELRTTVIQQFEEQIAAKGQSLQVDIPLDLPPACADTERIRQVFANLLDNAIKYTPHGGKIMISAFHRTSQKLEVSVCDTGLGIPEEDQSRIFENTVRLGRDQGTPGYGIGLALCDRIIKAHFCRIWVDSRVPEGSCFRFTLPVFDE